MRLAPRAILHLAVTAGLLLATGCASADEPTVAAPAPVEETDEPDDPSEDVVPDVASDEDIEVTEGASGESGDDEAAAATVTIVEDGTDFAFTPDDVTLAVGESVRFVHEGAAAHTVSGGGLNSGQLETGDEYLVTFEEPGEVSYFCYFHPDMTGTITVG